MAAKYGSETPQNIETPTLAIIPDIALPRGWSWVDLESVASFENGDRSSNYPSQSDRVDYGIPFINTGHIQPNGRLTHDRMEYITKASFDRLRAGKVRPGDIVYCLRGSTIGKTARNDFAEGAIASSLVIVRSKSNAYQEYLYFYLTGPFAQQLVRQRDNGSAQPNLSVRTLGQYPVPLPPLVEQRTISRILSAFDDKIELNRRMNETLEVVARALFKSWFVDFDPVRAKADGRDPGLPERINELLPESFDDLGSQEVPSGWKLCGLDEIARFLNGLALQKFPATSDDWLPVIKIAQLRTGDVVGADKASADIPPDYVVADGDVLFSWSGSLECVLWAGGKGALNQHLFKVDSSKCPKWLYYLWIRQHLDEFRHIAAGKATTMGHIQRHHLSEAKVALPPADLLKALDPIFAPLIESQWRRSVQSRTLAELRDTLLPKLISGELRVKEAEKQVGAVA